MRNKQNPVSIVSLNISAITEYFRDAVGISKDSFHLERGLQSDSFLFVSKREYEAEKIFF